MARKTLAHLGLPTTAPIPDPARRKAQAAFWDRGPPEVAQREAPEFDESPAFDFDQRLPDSELFA